MDQLIDYIQNQFLTTLQSIIDTIVGVLPSLLGAILLLTFGWLVGRSVSFIIKKLLRNINFDKLAETPPLQNYWDQANIQAKPSDILGKFVYWVIYLIFLVMATDALGLNMISAGITNLVSYLPKLLSALMIFLIGLYIISFVRDFIAAATASLGMSAGKFISGTVFYLMLTVLALTTLQQAGIDTDIITANLNIILAAVLFSFALGYGFASRDVLTNIIASFFSRRNFEIGQIIEMDGLKGEIVDISTISIRIKTAEGEMLVPSQELITKRVKILN